MKKKVLKIVGIVVAAIILLVLLVVAVVSLGERIKYWDFHKNTEKGMAIPGLWDGYVPQGFDYIEERGLYLTSGYMKNGEASRVYVMDEDGEARCVLLKNQDGTDNTTHAGGITFDGEYVYITGSGENDGKADTVDVYTLIDILDGDGVATVCDQIEICVNPSFVYARDGVLYVGEFYMAGSYETEESHHLTTPSGEQNTALIAVYNLGEDGTPDSIVPDHVLSIGGMAQGITFDEQGRLFISTSYGLSTSHIYVYDMDLTQSVDGAIEIAGEKVRVRYVDSTCLDATIQAPPMSEEMVIKDGRLLIMTESASMKYIFGKIIGANNAYSYDLSAIE